jgi:hypothetical protein
VTDTVWLSREQRAEASFVDGMTQLRSHVEQPEGRAAVDALTEAMLRFGACERRMRRAQRLRVLNDSKVDLAELEESALKDNARGLSALAGLKPFVELLSTAETSAAELALWRVSSPDIRAEWRDRVAEVDLSQADAQHLARIMDECCDAIDEAGAAGLGSHLARTLEELETARRSDDRGTHAASFPYWKVVTAAAVFGLTIAAVNMLLSRGAPWWAPFLVALLGVILVFVSAIGCW